MLKSIFAWIWGAIVWIAQTIWWLITWIAWGIWQAIVWLAQGAWWLIKWIAWIISRPFVWLGQGIWWLLKRIGRIISRPFVWLYQLFEWAYLSFISLPIYIQIVAISIIILIPFIIFLKKIYYKKRWEFLSPEKKASIQTKTEKHLNQKRKRQIKKIAKKQEYSIERWEKKIASLKEEYKSCKDDLDGKSPKSVLKDFMTTDYSDSFESSLLDAFLGSDERRARAIVFNFDVAYQGYFYQYKIKEAKIKQLGVNLSFNRKKALMYCAQVNNIYYKLSKQKNFNIKNTDIKEFLNNLNYDDINKLSLKIKNIVKALEDSKAYDNTSMKMSLLDINRYLDYKEQDLITSGEALFGVAASLLDGLMSNYENRAKRKQELKREFNSLKKKTSALYKANSKTNILEKRLKELNTTIEELLDRFLHIYNYLNETLYPDGDLNKSMESRFIHCFSGNGFKDYLFSEEKYLIKDINMLVTIGNALKEFTKMEI